MNPLERIRNELKSHPNLRYIDQPDSITVFPVSRNGFTVNIKEMNRIFIVSFNGLRQVFLKNNNGAEYALKMFRFGLSESCRLLVHSTGSRELKWEIEYRDYELNQWVKATTFFPFWFKFSISRETKYLQNSGIIKDNLTASYLSIDNEQKRGKALTILLVVYIISGYVVFQNFDVESLGFFIGLFPFIILVIYVPIFAIQIWFDDKKIFFDKRTGSPQKEVNYIIAWISIWLILIATVSKIFGSQMVTGFSIFFWPFILPVVLIPIFILYQKLIEKKKKQAKSSPKNTV